LALAEEIFKDQTTQLLEMVQQVQLLVQPSQQFQQLAEAEALVITQQVITQVLQVARAVEVGLLGLMQPQEALEQQTKVLLEELQTPLFIIRIQQVAVAALAQQVAQQLVATAEKLAVMVESVLLQQLLVHQSSVLVVALV
jgi:hypothetical protein